MICTINDYELREWHESLYFELWVLNIDLYDMTINDYEFHEYKQNVDE